MKHFRISTAYGLFVLAMAVLSQSLLPLMCIPIWIVSLLFDFDEYAWWKMEGKTFSGRGQEDGDR